MAITNIPSAEQQHLLFLFLPINKQFQAQAQEAVLQINSLVTDKSNEVGQDIRALTGVHYFMFHLQLDGAKSTLPVPTFQNAEGRHLLIVQSIYDADFAPYIKSFVDNPVIAEKLNDIVKIIDEIGIDPNDPTSAVFISKNGGVKSNPEAFNCLLMRYNFADPTVPASITTPAGQKASYLFGGTFPGLTVGKILQNYPDAETLWPATPGPITYEPSYKPQC